MLRGIDGTIASNESETTLFVYFKLPHIMFISFIFPFSPQGWKNTLISKNGNLITPQIIGTPVDIDFLESRVQYYRGEISEKQEKKIIESLKKKPKRAKDSKSYELFLKQRLEKLKKD